MKWRNFTYKQRFYLGLSLGGLLLIVFFKIGISPTLELNKSINEIEDRLGEVDDAPLEIVRLEARISAMDSLLGNAADKDFNFQSNLLDVFNRLSMRNGVTISEFAQPHQMDYADYSIETYPVQFQGKFTNLLKLLYSYETANYPGKIKHVRFYTEKKPGETETRLLLSIYIQNIRQNETE